MRALVGRDGREGVAFSLSKAQREAVLVYCRIAASSGALLSIEDLADLLTADASEEELEEAISSDQSLSSQVYVESGLVALLSPGSDRGTARKAIEEAEKRRRRALSNIQAARVFSRRFSRGTMFVAVAGTNSYLSALAGDDIDFYCITKTDGMWAFMLKALVLSRVISSVRRSTPPFCFSYVMDKRRAIDEPRGLMTAVHARDTLMAKTITGEPTYHAVLERSPWMKSFFPSLYERRLRETSSAQEPVPSLGKGSRIVNLWLFHTVGPYLALKAWLLNRRLSKKGDQDAVFKAWIEPGRLEYASRRYLELGKMYEALEKR
ncbi:MAG: hypothetical protein OK442_05475 [Thaumarchaeota archaeon]|nr:hypothetical protein [Nitrososphaerota archaeon]